MFKLRIFHSWRHRFRWRSICITNCEKCILFSLLDRCEEMKNHFLKKLQLLSEPSYKKFGCCATGLELGCCSVAKFCPTLCDHMGSSKPGFPVLHYLCSSCSLSWWCSLTNSSSVAPFSCPQSFLASRSFPMSRVFSLGGQSIGVSALTSVLPKSIQG